MAKSKSGKRLKIDQSAKQAETASIKGGKGHVGMTKQGKGKGSSLTETVRRVPEELSKGIDELGGL
ncbi:hypothetical protein A8W25_14470 [Streptomyces sp. ERV7]|uniref:hypothetical protein n=1 Tax=Streptomyces sp. ERV7 TaxID=1322334 RepID=UPI0007F518A5|nr:hypothetical protein [Streptomyces sp. ERV7]OAR23716.1 hypothetical protein A8W25_14470 [Streptomyces sp. ERV7]